MPCFPAAQQISSIMIVLDAETAVAGLLRNSHQERHPGKPGHLHWGLQAHA